MSSHATLGAAADDRKARLAKLRSIKRKQPADEIVPPESDRASPAFASADEDKNDKNAEPDVSRLHLSGRNYDPETRGAKLGFEAPPNLAAGDHTLEAKAAVLEAQVRQQQEEEEGGEEGVAGGGVSGGAGIDLFKLQPKKPNWDLKRELNKRLETLNNRTDNAIARLVRERLAAKQQEQKQKKQVSNSKADSQEDGEGGLEGAALVESLRVREAEDADEARREREADEE